jgi:hypothetical protein
MANDPNSVSLTFYTDTAALDRAGRSVDQLHSQVARFDAGMSRSAAGTRNWGLVAFQAGQAVQDATYGFQGAINNLSMIGMMMGAGGAFGIGLQVGLTGVLLLTQNWERLSRVVQGSNAIPKVGTDFDRLNESLKETNKQLDDLKSKGTLTDSELKQFTVLSDIAGMQRKRADTASAARGVASMLTPEQEASANAFRAALKEVGGADTMFAAAEKKSGGPLNEVERGGIEAAIQAALGGDTFNADYLARAFGGDKFRQALERERDKNAGLEEEIARDQAESVRRLNKRKAAKEREAEEQLQKDREFIRQQSVKLEQDFIKAQQKEQVRLGRMNAAGDRRAAAMDVQVAASGGADMLAAAANDLIFAGGGHAGRMTGSAKQRAMLKYMRQGMSRKDAMARVNADEAAAMQGAEWQALQQAMGGLEQQLIANGATPEFAKQYASAAARGVLGQTAGDEQIKNTDALAALTDSVNRLERNGIPMNWRRRGG